jgi:peptidoglycan/LPS O-acetylase OafA/YrhL
MPNRGASANLDVLRSMAVLLVLVDHLTRHFHRDRFGVLGTFGVLLFFVHTSLVLMHSMQRSRLSGRALLKDFYVRRFFRIYPLSVLAVWTAFGLKLHADVRGLIPSAMPGKFELLSNLFLIQNLTGARSMIGPLWSLPIEVQMYVVLPFLFMWKRLSIRLLLVLWLVCGLLGHFAQTVPQLAWFSLLLYVPNFLPGIIAFKIPQKRTIPSYGWPLFIIGLAALFWWIPSRRVGAELCLLLGIMLPKFKEISFRPLVWVANRIATYSYGIYLGHSFFIWYALTYHHSWLLFWAMWLVIPAVVYYVFELPAINFGRKLATRISTPPQAGTYPHAVVSEAAAS